MTRPMRCAPQLLRLGGALLLLCTAGCTTGAIFTHITIPCDLDANSTKLHQADDKSSLDSLRINILRVDWGGRGLAATAREHGFESIAYADLEILQVLGVWRQEFAVIYGKRKTEPEFRAGIPPS